MKDFKPLDLEDRNVFQERLAQDPPEISEMTFTNLWMWRHRYNPVYAVRDGLLLVIVQPEDGPPFALPPAGDGDKGAALEYLTEVMTEHGARPMIARAGESFVNRWVDRDAFEVIPDPDNSDYVYLTEHLIELPGNKFHGKKNHLNQFLKNYEFEYRDLDAKTARQFLDLQETWCDIKDCDDKPGLFYENIAIYQALSRHADLQLTGGAILIDGKVEAFSLGEQLNRDTAVIHTEKANPDIRGLYVAINQRFCQEAWSHLTYVNREQDMGIEGLRKAKESYNPHHKVEKFVVTPKS